ncbi:hypothetical protein NEOKW01_2002 [Nematocida sp. AWRm80]|nr:hypothetical protein NEOKW01_2002 [Nematocida sp. AWRm80]
MTELREDLKDTSGKTGPGYSLHDKQLIKSTDPKGNEDMYADSNDGFVGHQESSTYKESKSTEGYAYGKEYVYNGAEFNRAEYDEQNEDQMHLEILASSVSGGITKENTSRESGQIYPHEFTGRQYRATTGSERSPLSLGHEMDRDKHPNRYSPRGHHLQNLSPGQSSDMSNSMDKPGAVPGGPAGPISSLRFFKNEEIEDSFESDDDIGPRMNKGRKKIKMEFIKDKGRRGVTFSKRKKGIMKKAYELNVLTKCEILLVVASETGHVYTFATPKLQPIIKQHENLIQQYLNAPGIGEGNKMYESPERFPPEDTGYYKPTDAYGYDNILQDHGYSSGYYHSGYDTDNSPSNDP